MGVCARPNIYDRGGPRVYGDLSVDVNHSGEANGARSQK